MGNEELIHVSVEGTEFVAIVDSAYGVRPGNTVSMKLPIARLHLFHPETGDSLREERLGDPGRRRRRRDSAVTA